MGTEIPDVWARTAEISFGGTDVTRHDFYECFEGSSSSVVSDFDAVSRLPGRAVCVSRIGFKTVQGHVAFLEKFSNRESVIINDKEVRIRVRDRSINLLRVRIQHFKFDDDLNLLETRLRESSIETRSHKSGLKTRFHRFGPETRFRMPGVDGVTRVDDAARAVFGPASDGSPPARRRRSAARGAPR